MVQRDRLLSDARETEIGDFKGLVWDGGMHWWIYLSHRLSWCADRNRNYSGPVGNAFPIRHSVTENTYSTTADRN